MRRMCVVATAAVALVVALAGHRPLMAQAAPTSGGPVDRAVLEDLAAAYRVLAAEGVIDAYGHVSMRHPGNPNRYLMSRSLGPELVTAEDIMEYDLDSTPVDPKGRLSVQERFIHGSIFKARKDVNVVVHSHAPSVIPFSVTNVPLRPVYHMASFLWQGVPVWDTRSVKGDPDAPALLIRNNNMGDSLAKALGDKPVALIRGHGNVVVGAGLPLTIRYAIYTEENARMQLAAMQMGGGQVNYITAEEGLARDKAPGDVQRGWELWKRKAMAK
jgi:HCOMODA/2-hydroxy-3-carboxy-muconic semialdehyde decarboxylase